MRIVENLVRRGIARVETDPQRRIALHMKDMVRADDADRDDALPHDDGRESTMTTKTICIQLTDWILNAV